jgi:FAD:protein FMN transferase
MMTTTQPVLDRIRGSARWSSAAGWHHLSFQALGSPCRVQFASSRRPQEIGEPLLQWMAGFEANYSRFLPTSLICRINAAAGKEWVAIDAETERLFALCQEMHFLTRGVFDPTSLPLVELWNWKIQPPVVPDDAAIQGALAKVGWRKFQRAPGKVFLPEPGMGIDLGGMGKEYAVDQALQLVQQAGATSVLVDFGHDVRVFGPAPEGKPAWHIGLEDPRQPGKCWTGLAVNNLAVASSGDYLRGFTHEGRRYGHILDVRTGRPVANGCLLASGVAPSCTLAGMLSTAAFVLGPQEGVRLMDATYGAAGAVVSETGLVTSRRFAEFATR